MPFGSLITKRWHLLSSCRLTGSDRGIGRRSVSNAISQYIRTSCGNHRPTAGQHNRHWRLSEDLTLVGWYTDCVYCLLEKHSTSDHLPEPKTDTERTEQFNDMHRTLHSRQVTASNWLRLRTEDLGHFATLFTHSDIYIMREGSQVANRNQLMCGSSQL